MHLMVETTNLKLDTGVHDRPMTIRDAARYLEVTTRTVDRWIREQDLPVHRLGTGPKARKRFFASELDTWIRNRCSDATPVGGVLR